MLRGFLDEQKHEGGRGREVEGLCAVIHTEEHCNYFLCVSFLSQARACYKFYEQSCHIVILPLELYVLSNLMSFPYLLSQRGMSHVGTGTAFYVLPCSPAPWAADWASSTPCSPRGSWKMIMLNARGAASPQSPLPTSEASLITFFSRPFHELRYP